MNKLEAVREAIVAANPDLATNPDRFKIWADKGRLVSRRTSGLGFEWRFRANLLFEGLAGSPDDIAVPLLLWLRSAQPELLLNFEKGDQAIVFEAHILNAHSWDLLIQFDLSEGVTVTPKEDGGWNMVHLGEPPVEDPVLPGAAGATLAQIWAAGEQLLPPP